MSTSSENNQHHDLDPDYTHKPRNDNYHSPILTATNVTTVEMASFPAGTIFLTILVTVRASALHNERTPEVHYEPNWDSIDSRPLPSWYDEAKLGIFIHWGVFSVPSFGSEWFWENWEGKKIPNYIDFMKNNYRLDWTYADFAKDFTAEFYDANTWAELFADSGAKYIVFVTKHHEGFCNWPTNVSFNWNSQMLGPKRDIVGELEQAIRSKTDLHFGLYHSLYEWFHPLYLKDVANNFTTRDFVLTKTMPELFELVNTYKPDIVWSDGPIGPDTYWGSTQFLAWLYNDSPVKDVVVTNDRWGNNKIKCHHGGVLTCWDRYNPGVLQPRKWVNAMTIDKTSWGFRREASLEDFLTMEEIIETFVETVSCGGNMLMNVGPTKYGMITPIYEERLRGMGQWLKVNGEAIYGSKPWSHQNDTVTPRVWYTQNEGFVYAIIFSWPTGTMNNLVLSAPVPTTSTTVTLLGYMGQFTWDKRSSGGMTINVPAIPVNQMPCQWGWVFKLTGIEN
ncbi:alpha-L-fucosidase-like isoform X1 [Haliotis rufescens]|uniref:alpha-L-fucosidase-like isoform X1 n=1 Tax=Haliotis rufescens TaxID=6454 RepID=UPI00201F372B|nr:alpha-L-fucosidase-like isoform X1 [Haliotis rufescens]